MYREQYGEYAYWCIENSMGSLHFDIRVERVKGATLRLVRHEKVLQFVMCNPFQCPPSLPLVLLILLLHVFTSWKGRCFSTTLNTSCSLLRSNSLKCHAKLLLKGRRLLRDIPNSSVTEINSLIAIWILSGCWTLGSSDKEGKPNSHFASFGWHTTVCG